MTVRFLSLAGYFRRRFGGRARKIPLDAGFTCPNRDGTLPGRGCVFCNPRGAGAGLNAQGLTLREQWRFWRERVGRKDATRFFLAYLQSFSNTHGPLERVAAALDQLRGLDGLSGLCLATRPDCLDGPKLDLLAAQPMEEIWLDLGLQSASDATLARIERGHDAACFARAARAADARGLKVCAHVMAGLPGEAEDELLATVDFLNELPVKGIKFHNLLVCRGAPLAEDWRRGTYPPLAEDRYLDLLAAALIRLRPDVVIHRLFADPAPDELLAPAWAGRKRDLLARFQARLAADDLWQGQARFAPLAAPAWFAEGRPPWLEASPPDAPRPPIVNPEEPS